MEDIHPQQLKKAKPKKVSFSLALAIVRIFFQEQRRRPLQTKQSNSPVQLFCLSRALRRRCLVYNTISFLSYYSLYHHVFSCFLGHLKRILNSVYTFI